MCDRVLFGDAEVMGARYYLAVFNYDGADRAFFDIVCFVGLFYSLQHKVLFVALWSCLKYLFSGLHVHIIY